MQEPAVRAVPTTEEILATKASNYQWKEELFGRWFTAGSSSNFLEHDTLVMMIREGFIVDR